MKERVKISVETKNMQNKIKKRKGKKRKESCFFQKSIK